MIAHRTMMIGAILALAALGAVDPPPTTTRPVPVVGPEKTDHSDPPIPIVVDAPATLNALWERLKAPDFILIRGDRYQALLKATSSSTKPAAPEPTVSAVSVRGIAGAKHAELSVHFAVDTVEAGPRWVSLKLDGLPLSTVKEGGKILPVRNTAGGGWETEVSGPGNHAIEVSLVSEVATNGEERRVELAIPLAATTTVDLTVAEDAIEASMGSHDPVVPQKLPDHRGVRLAASITPRSRLSVTWRAALDHSGLLPPLLSTRAEILLEVSPDSIRSRVRWKVSAVRGTTRELSFAFDADEELIDLDLDNRPLATDTRVFGASRILTIPLPEPLRQGSTARNLTMTTRRRIVADTPTKVALKGYALRDASLQTGVMAISRTGAIWTEGHAGRGLVRIDPAGDLPDELRSRPGTILAYRFFEQPFELGLVVEPALPRLESRVKRTVTLLRDAALCETRYQFRATEGRVYELQFRIPDDLVLEPIVPDDTVDSSNLGPDVSKGAEAGRKRPYRLLSVRLSSRVRDRGQFSLKLATRQPLEKGAAAIDLIEPMNAVSLGGRVAIRHVAGIEIDPEKSCTGPNGPTGFRLGLAAGDAGWTWPSEPNPSLLDPDVTWLDHDGRPVVLPIGVSVRPRSIRSETRIEANVSRSGIDYRESIHLDVRNGSLSEIRVSVPPSADSSWKTEGPEVASREYLETRKDGSRLFRLSLAKAPVRSADLRFVYRTAFEPTLAAEPPRSDRFSMIGLEPEIVGGVRFSFGSEPGVNLVVDAADWRSGLDARSDLADVPTADVSRVVWKDTVAELPSFRASALPLQPMPGLIVGRAYLRTIIGTTDVRTVAMYRLDAHGPSLDLDLPAEARLLQTKVDGLPVAEIERLDAASRYRIRLPVVAGSTPTSLTLEYATPRRSPSAWKTPTIDGATVQSVYRQVDVPASSALMGVPSGWADENEWHWDHYVWVRNPSASPRELQNWVEGRSNRDDPARAEPLHRSNAHAYLFRTTDGVGAISVTIVPRVVLVGVCSGLVGLAGIALVLLRPAVRFLMIPVVTLIFIMAFAWSPDVTFQVVQSGLLGVLLALIAAGLQRLVDRKRAASPRLSETTASVQAPSATTTALREPVGSDDSTAIRKRPQSSLGQILVAPPSISGSVREPSSPDSRRPS